MRIFPFIKTILTNNCNMKIIKKTSLGVMLLVMTALFLSSCSSTPDSLKVIPKDTNLVTSMDVYSIATKGKLTDMSEFSFFKAFNTEIKNENKKIGKMVDDLMEDPLSSGLDFTSDLFFFLLDKGQEGTYMCFSIEMNSEKKFTQFVKDLLKESGAELTIEEAESYKHLNFGGEMAMAWDSEKLVLASPQSYRGRKNLMSQIETLISLDKKDQITSNEDFNQFYSKTKDLNFWMSTNIMADFPGMNQIKDQIGFDIKDNQISAFLDFSTDKISLKTEFKPNAELQKQMDEYNILNNDFDKDLLKLFPSNSYMAISASLNPEGYYKLLSKQESFDVMLKELQKLYPLDIKEMFESVSGNMVYTMYTNDEVTEDEVSIPMMGFAFDIKNDKMLKELVNNLPAEAKKGENEFAMEVIPGTSAYIIYDDSKCLITNDLNSVKAFKENTPYASKHLGNSKLAKNLSSNSMYMYMNLDFSSYSSSLKNQIQDSRITSMFDTWSQMAKSMEMKQINSTSNEFIFTTGDDGTNSLYKIISTVDKNLNKFAPF